MPLEHVHALHDLEAVADVAAQRGVHVGDHGSDAAAVMGADGDHQLGQLDALLHGLHERAGAGGDIQQDGVRAGGQLLGHDAGCDEGDAADGGSDVPEGVHLFIRHGDAFALADDRQADLVHLREELLLREGGLGAGDALHLVDGAAGVTESAAAHLGETEGVQQTQSVFFGLYHIDMVGYQGHVIPVVIAVWILSVLEKKLHKIVPEVLDLFVTPLVSVFVTGYLTLSIVGPIFVWAENAILGAIQWMLTLPLGLGSLIMGSLYAPTVVTGIHQMYTAIDIGQLAKYGVTYWLPLASAANVAQGAAALAVAVKSKDQKIKSLALPSSLSAFMGITEPAIFGVNLRFFKPFIAGCIGGGCGALYASLVHLGAKGTGVTGIFGILLCLNQPLQYVIEMAIAVGVAFAVSFALYKDKKKEPVAEAPVTVAASVEKTDSEESAASETKTASGNTKTTSSEEVLNAPVNGKIIPNDQIADDTFAAEVLGKTVAIEPADGIITAPCDGEIVSIFDTGHAVCILTDGGAELLIHVGIDTVKMDGNGFTKKVSDGAKVHAGDVLIEADLNAIKEAGHPATTMMILTNTDLYDSVECAAPGTVTGKSSVMKLTK